MLQLQNVSFEEYVIENGFENFVSSNHQSDFAKYVNNFINHLEKLSDNDMYNLLNNPDTFVIYDSVSNLSYTATTEFYGSKSDFEINLISVEVGKKATLCTIEVPSLVVLH